MSLVLSAETRINGAERLFQFSIQTNFPYGVVVLPSFWPVLTQKATSYIPVPLFKNSSSSSLAETLSCRRGRPSPLGVGFGVSKPHVTIESDNLKGESPTTEVMEFIVDEKSSFFVRTRIYAIPSACDGCSVFDGGSLGTYSTRQRAGLVLQSIQLGLALTLSFRGVISPQKKGKTPLSLGADISHSST